jgi:hypothetical protein
MRVAICYFGLMRTIKQRYPSHLKNLYEVLKRENIEYDIYVHTWSSPDIPDNRDYEILNPTDVVVDDQTIFSKELEPHFWRYFDQHMFNLYGGDTHHEWHPIKTRNHIYFTESQKRVTKLCKSKNIDYDWVIYSRCDIDYMKEIPVDLLHFYRHRPDTILIPKTHCCWGMNDCFAIVLYEKCEIYGNRGDQMIAYRQTGRRLVNEEFLAYVLTTQFKHICLIDFEVNILRT